MNFAKAFLVGMMMLSSYAQAADGTKIDGKYKLYLYFGDTTPFRDDLTIRVGSIINGTMHVPDDFDADIENAVLTPQGRLSFHLTLPAKYDQAFPGGLDYVLHFESPEVSSTPKSFERLVGFVLSPRTKAYIGTIVGFKE